jgi:phosphoenolpyruvate synthase/pyruvate phosphate dikinase
MEYNGRVASKGTASGILYWAKEGEDIPEGCILGAIVSREMGKPCVVGLGDTFPGESLAGKLVTVDGDTGIVTVEGE